MCWWVCMVRGCTQKVHLCLYECEPPSRGIMLSRFVLQVDNVPMLKEGGQVLRDAIQNTVIELIQEARAQQAVV